MQHDLTAPVQRGLAVYYVLIAAFNAGVAYYFVKARNRGQALTWILVAGLFLLHALAYLSPAGHGLVIPESATFLVDAATNAVSYFVLSTLLFIAVLAFRGFFTSPLVALALLNVILLFAGWAMTNTDFRAIVAKEDNIPIVILLFTVGFFTWLALRRAVINDDLIAQNKPPLEKDDDKVLVWPDLVYTELICMVIATAVLIVWAVFLKAPLEQPATSAKAPNPSKAPWYFLGLQEMLVYFDPWLAGVVLPGLIIAGLIAIPYIDKNPKGNGYFTFKERKAEISIFLFGFAVLWVSLIVLGTFLRGPNWNFFGPFEFWDIHKLEALTNVNLSEYVWVRLFRIGMPSFWLIREAPGILLVIFYVFALPVILAKTVFKTYYEKLGAARYYVGAFLFVSMMSLPLKMLSRWLFNLKYIVNIGEYFFNI